MRQTTNLPGRSTSKLNTQIRRMLDGQSALRPARSPGMYTSQTVNGVVQRPKARVNNDNQTSIVPRWG